jgi:hypothetical protein
MLTVIHRRGLVEQHSMNRTMTRIETSVPTVSARGYRGAAGTDSISSFSACEIVLVPLLQSFCTCRYLQIHKDIAMIMEWSPRFRSALTRERLCPMFTQYLPSRVRVVFIVSLSFPIASQVEQIDSS